MNAVTFDERVRSPDKKSDDYGKMWIVIFHADWCPKATSLYPLFAKLSCREMDPSQRCWGKVDLEQFPQLGKHLSIDMDPLTTKQLPSVIVFYKGKEQRRLPLFTSNGTVVDCAFSEQTLVKVMELDLSVNEIRSKRRKGK